ncbi:MAG: M28 family peptidase [Planctomycetota bacterium]|nr:M28 family peptidase [Planctomycetota bacterium]MDA1105454.1 M28 family peptidase [Planctomycetota bacterium]
MRSTTPNAAKSLALCILAGGLLATLAVTLSAAQDAAPTAAKPKGQIIPGTVTIYDYDPAAANGDGHLREYLENLGTDASLWYQHVMTLSNPFFEGRAPGLHGHDMATEYVEWHMTKAGLKPGFPNLNADGSVVDGGEATSSDWVSYRQPFELPGSGPKVVTSEVIANGNTLEAGADYVVLGNSGSGTVTAPIVFAGYAIDEGQDGYTSFGAGSDADLKGKIALIFRYEPVDADGNSQWDNRRWSKHASAAAKFESLAKRGVAGVIMVTPPECPRARKGMESTATSRFGERLDVPTIQLDGAQADALLTSVDSKGRSLMDFRKMADSGEVKTITLAANKPVTLNVETTKGVTETANLGGVLPGSGALADEWVIVGSHYDHVGYGYFGADPRNRGKLHPGADDNASGTSAMLVLANRIAKEYAAADAPADKRSILFMAFSAEESGLEGSDFWTKHPSLPTDKVNAMINLDMVGRLRNLDLAVGGTGTAEGFMDKLTPIFESSGMTIRADPSGRGPSDHASFDKVGIPVLFLFTGVHGDYHKPTDFGWTVDPRGAKRVIDLADQLIDLAATNTPKFVYTKPARGAGQDRGLAKVRFGIAPAYTDSGKGLKVEGVSEGTSAADAGIKEGDVILSWNGDELNGAGDLATFLRKHEVGDVVKLTVERDGTTIEVPVTLKASTAQQSK